MKILTPRQLEVERVKLAVAMTNLSIEEAKVGIAAMQRRWPRWLSNLRQEAKVGIAAMQRKNRARRREIARQEKLAKTEAAK